MGELGCMEESMPSLRSWLFYHLTRRSLAKIRARHLSLPALRVEREVAARRLFKFPQAVSRRDATVSGMPFYFDCCALRNIVQ